MNYAWANPTTGVRERAPTKETARLQAWEALHASKNTRNALTVYEQDSAGVVYPHERNAAI